MSVRTIINLNSEHPLWSGAFPLYCYNTIECEMFQDISGKKINVSLWCGIHHQLLFHIYRGKDTQRKLRTCFKAWRFYVLFSGSNLSAHAAQNLPIHSISGNGRKQVKKVPAYATLLRALKPEVEYSFNRKFTLAY